MKSSYSFLYLLLAFLCSSSTVLAETHVVIVRDPFLSPSFFPKDLTISEGDVVRWEWDENNVDEHDVRAGTLPNQAPANYQEAFASEIAVTGLTFEVPFDRDFVNRYPTSGNLYEYYCAPHWAMGMAGSVTVVRQPKSFRANLTDWQVVPPTSSSSVASCDVTLAATEDSVSIDCSHDVSSPVSLELNLGALGANGQTICSWDISSNSSGLSCALSAEQAQSIWDGQVHLLLKSSTILTGELRGQIFHANGSASVSGQVSTSEGVGIDNVNVSAGVVQVQTDSSGNYQLSSVPNGVYLLSAVRAGMNISPTAGVNPVMVNNVSSTFKNFVATLDSTSSASNVDGDGDCVPDVQEALDGSNGQDAGSYRSRLTSPVYVLWNGFIELINILELVNRADGAVVMTVEVFDINGQLVHSQTIGLAPRSQQDLIVNDITGFQKDSYGLVKISFEQQYAGDIDGRMFYYRTSSSGLDYDFAFGTAFERPLCVDSYVGFNTFQPSLSAPEAQNLVAQWLAIVNLEPSTSQSFNVRRFNQAGALIQNDLITLAPFGRMDLEAGHINPGPNNVGLIEIDPVVDGRPYMAQLFRYGGNADPGLLPTAYRFAFPLLARHGNGEKMSLPISNMSGAQNWLEVANTLGQSTSFTLELRNSGGDLVQQSNVVLDPHSQQHFNMSAMLGVEESGTAVVLPSSRESIVAQSMYYFRDTQSGSISAMYGSQAKEALSQLSVGSYNRFISMQSWMRVNNLLSEPNNVALKVYSSSGPEEFQFLMSPNSTIDIGIHLPTYGTQANTYGLVTVEGGSYGSVSGELIRMRPDSTSNSGGLDFAAPTEVR